MTNEAEYLDLQDDAAADLQARALERRVIVQPDTANDIPLPEAVATLQQISARSHADLRAYEMPSGALT